VDIGSEVVSIVCELQHSKLSVCPRALPGSVLPSGARIERAEIRGESSVGMLCSEFELGLGEDAAGIMILPENGRLGQPISAELALEDSVFDISITPNRGDCLSILGLAREVAAF